MPRHSLFIPDLPRAGESLTLTGDEATHALRVKRLRTGDRVRAFDGAGRVALAHVTIARRELGLEIDSIERFDRLVPAIGVWSAVPKGPRVGELFEHLSQVGAASWTPMNSGRASVDPARAMTNAKMQRLARISIESMKQCHRPWRLELNKTRTFGDAIHAVGGTAIVLADCSGKAYRATGAGRIRLLVGPEGGWTKDELAAAESAGAAVSSFGPHVMRIELAAAIAAATVLDKEQSRRDP